MLTRLNECIKNVFNGEQVDPEYRVFWTVVPISGLIGFICTVGSICRPLKAPAILSTLACTLCCIIMMARCEKTRETQRCYRAFCLIENCALLPIAFVMNGGMHTDMPLYSLGGIILCAFCVTRKDRLITLSASIVLNANLFIESIFHPSFISRLDCGIVEEDIVIGFLFVSIGVSIIINSLLGGQIERVYKETNIGLIEVLSSVIEFRSAETGNHIKNIKELMSILLDAANAVVDGRYYSDQEINIISSATVLHDIGKIVIPDSILNKPGRLTEEEFSIIKKHPLEGCKIIESIKDIQGTEYYCYSYEICRHHHEAYDGSGYPDGISGDNIPFVSQLASLADVYEALRSERGYKQAYSSEETYQIITTECKGKFSEDVIKCYKYARQKMDLAVCPVENDPT